MRVRVRVRVRVGVQCSIMMVSTLGRPRVLDEFDGAHRAAHRVRLLEEAEAHMHIYRKCLYMHMGGVITRERCLLEEAEEHAQLHLLWGGVIARERCLLEEAEEHAQGVGHEPRVARLGLGRGAHLEGAHTHRVAAPIT